MHLALCFPAVDLTCTALRVLPLFDSPQVYIVQCAINGSEQWLLEKVRRVSPSVCRAHPDPCALHLQRYSDFRRLYKSLASKNLSPQSCSFPKK